MKEKPKGTGQSLANDGLPHDIVIAFAKGAGAVAGGVAVKAAIHGAKNVIAKKKASAEKPSIILTDK